MPETQTEREVVIDEAARPVENGRMTILDVLRRRHIPTDAIRAQTDRTRAIAKRIRQIVVVGVTLAGCATCPPGTHENAENVRALVVDVERFSPPGEDPVLRDARDARNDAAVRLAEALRRECDR